MGGTDGTGGDNTKESVEGGDERDADEIMNDRFELPMPSNADVKAFDLRGYARTRLVMCMPPHSA